MNKEKAEEKCEKSGCSDCNDFINEEPSAGSYLLQFLVGLGLLCAGGFLVTQNTILTTKFSLMDLIGFTPPFGLVMLPLLIGIGVLFFNSKSLLGWILTGLGSLIIILGIIMGLTIYFRPVTLFQGILMFGMIAAGLGLLAKVLSKARG